MNKELYKKNAMLVLSHISKAGSLYKNCIASKIAQNLGLSIGSVFEILKKFEKMGIISGTRFGRAVVYQPISNHPMIKYFRIFDNLWELNDLVTSLKEHCRKIILFGSCARGEDTFESDIDLCVIADEDKQTEVRKIISDFSTDREIKPVIVDTSEFMEMQNTDKVFYNEIMKGIELLGDINERD